MSARMHLLLQVDPGHAPEAAQYIGALPGVVDASHTSGAYDVVATVECNAQQVQHCLSLVRRTPRLTVLRICKVGAAPIPSMA